MRDVLDAVAEGEMSVSEAEARLRGYASGDAGRFDATRTSRSGIPEAILASGKTTEEVGELATLSLETTDRAIVTRLDPADRGAVESSIRDAHPDTGIEYDDRSEVLTAHQPSFERPSLDASIGIVTAGTSDGLPAGEAAIIVREMGAEVERFDDVGVASIARILDCVPDLRKLDVLVVAAGREGALPTVVAGLVDVPVIGLPVSMGYGEGGAGEAALLGMLQSCTALTVVNVDAGFTAGAQAGLIARQIHRARNS